MGSFLFKWGHPANEVFVTGTFDDWGKTVKLEKKDGNLHEKMVELPKASEKIYYKFVVDGNWIADHTAPIEYDDNDNINNVLLPEHITKKGSTEPSTGHPATTGIMAGVVPQSTTAQLAGTVPKESEKDLGRTTSSDLPGSFPETPAAELSEYSVNPIPATTGAGNPVQLEPNEKVPDPSTLTSNTITSTVKDDPELMSEKDAMKKEESEQTFGVAPLPATTGVGNPIQLQPGEKVPHPSNFTNNSINSMVTLDKESYEKGSSAAPVLPDVITPQAERDAKGGMFSMPGITNNMIPESSLPMGNGTKAEMEKDAGPVIQSSGPNTTTAALAAQVPVEPRGVPEVVSESQKEAGFAPEASANPEAVVEKTAMEKELESKVAEEPPTAEGIGQNPATEAASANAEGGLTGEEIAALVAGGTLATAGAGAAGVAAMASKAEASTTAIAPTVPDVVQKSIAEAHQSPEAAASKIMVEEKSAMESQLLKEVKTEEASGEPAPTEAAALSESAPMATGMSKTETPTMTTAETPAMTPAAKNAVAQAVDSRDISPMSKTPTAAQTEPTVATGVASTTTTPITTPMKTEKSKMESPAVSSPMSSKNGESSSTPTDKKSKRKSGFFGKIKEKFTHHDKK